MKDYLITTDNMSDFPEEYYAEHDLPRMSLSYQMGGEIYNDNRPMPYQEFYQRMRGGQMPVTSQINPTEARNYLDQYIKKNKNILHIAFSGGLSGSYNSVCMAAKELMEERPDVRITVIDSLCASLGEGLLVHKALQLQEQGMSYEALADWVLEHRRNVCHNFTVDNLFHLYRGGRVSRTTAILGTMIQIKPVLHVDDEGHLKAIAKACGRKKSLQMLVDHMEKQIGSWRDKNDVVFISHGDCQEDAQYVKELVEKRFGIHQFLISPVGPTIGAHSGPGTLALFYMGDNRRPE